MKSILTST